MKVLVTGASGFIGNHVVRCLLGNSHEVIASSRTAQSFRNKSWFKDVSYIAHRLEDDPSILTERCGPVDAVVHLAWQGLENYNSLVHVEDNLIHNYRFIKKIVEMEKE